MASFLQWLKKENAENLMLFLFKKKNGFMYALQETGKNNPLLFHSTGGQKSTGFNHSWQPSLWHRREHSLTANVVVLGIQPSCRSAEKEPNAAWHHKRAICCHKGQSTNLSSKKLPFPHHQTGCIFSEENEYLSLEEGCTLQGFNQKNLLSRGSRTR
jgi:hypothetical protein